ncbi:uncharacterized protein LOC127792341 [Diospyros lotus]|uniref:uncharacterized protein LOC127792341 n=1 Tax=Diospyros lotus TaxID=55363 RepID=UPI00225241E6|nr:uncharacterized protein LOC127792341 [Diospyros lotus]
MELQQSTHNISVTWRGKKFILEMNSAATLKDLGFELQKLTDVQADTMRLIVPQASDRSSKLLSPFSDEHECLSLQETSFFKRKSIRMMGVPKDEVDEILQNEKTNLRIAGFEEEEKRLRQRMLDRPHGSLKLPQGQYIFCEFRTLHLPGVELNPPASEALKRMHMLAADPGIVAIMNKHHWRVGIMTEMAPVGYVGVSPKCILGFNMNHGEEISLRLRTDDLKGFRKYESIKKTLLHELAHMVYSEHDANFYALDKQLNQEAATLDWTKSKGHTLSGVKYSEPDVDLVLDNHGSVSKKLGGRASDQLADARATSVAAAYGRLANASTSLSEIPEVHQEPDSYDALGVNEEHKAINVVENMRIRASDKGQWKHDNEPDPDDCLGNESKFEPDPDDVEGGEAMEFEPYLHCTEVTIISEPDPDDSQMTQFPSVADVKMARTKPHEEPDPDEPEASLKDAVVVGASCSLLPELVNHNYQQEMMVDEPDPDDAQEEQTKICGNVANKMTESRSLLGAAVPDPDYSQAKRDTEAGLDDNNSITQPSIPSAHTEEPDPDDQELQRIQNPVAIICSRLQKAIEMLQSEVNPAEVAGVLQTLFKIIRNLIEHPNEMKFKKIRKGNPIIQRNVANYKAAMEILFLIGFIEDIMLAETYLVLKRNDPGLLWLAKSSLETCIAH